jgi:hypothetical protein
MTRECACKTGQAYPHSALTRLTQRHIMKILCINSLLTQTYQLVWAVCRMDTAQHSLSTEDEANKHDTPYGHSTKGEELYRLEARRHLHIHGIPVPADSKVFCIHVWRLLVLLKQLSVFLSTHISFTACLNRSIERIRIKMIYFTGHICF